MEDNQKRIEDIANRFGMKAPEDSENGRAIFYFTMNREYSLQLIDFSEINNPFPTSQEPNIKYTFLDLEDGKEKVTKLVSRAFFTAMFLNPNPMQAGDKFTVIKSKVNGKNRFTVKRIGDVE